MKCERLQIRKETDETHPDEVWDGTEWKKTSLAPSSLRELSYIEIDLAGLSEHRYFIAEYRNGLHTLRRMKK